ncbi:PilZ domain-containing protein [Stutzerimonas stutzeri]|uniref:PilZ domain-containing protein n=1 Tax=Stutzerimonas stutzeri TaxID=316 RepID=UPI00265B600B|nr:PilZ domain-containing protein [Stutzerimonas stutzeri]MCF6781871.1 PilZ domain-containing protein [Stutzerimonas stutzeri]MCF6803879.1 PilZ domain-containing protein [Stutzerimonas stutzeri]
MSIEDTEDRREYYRIEDMIALEILPLEGQGVRAGDSPSRLFDLLGELHQMDFEAQYLLRQISEQNRTLANYLKVQNRRIDLLGQALAQGLVKDIGPTREVGLSEGGLNFIHDQPLALDSIWTLKIVLMPQGLGMMLKARVVSCVARDDGQFAVSTAFEALTDAQRQLLARHILQKQAMERRLARENLQGT